MAFPSGKALCRYLNYLKAYITIVNKHTLGSFNMNIFESIVATAVVAMIGLGAYSIYNMAKDSNEAMRILKEFNKELMGLEEEIGSGSIKRVAAQEKATYLIALYKRRYLACTVDNDKNAKTFFDNQLSMIMEIIDLKL